MSEKDTNERVPNLVIAGVNKAGTTSLFSYLESHPDVSGSKVKETCYFLPLRYEEPIAEWSEYLSLFEPKNQNIVMEATPGYFYGGRVLAAEIAKKLPDTKIIVVLREPGSRLLSFFHFMKSMLQIDAEMTLKAYIEKCSELSANDFSEKRNNPYFGVEGGFYAKYLMGWHEVFGDRLRVVFFDDFVATTPQELASLAAWLGIDPEFYIDFNFAGSNQTVAYKFKPLHVLALFVNKKFEPFFRKFTGLKRALKTFYSLFNNRVKDPISASDHEMVKKIYVESNNELAKQLTKLSVGPLPKWLGGAHEGP